MKAALVTGASRRIGRAIALELARRGFAVALHYNSTEPGLLVDEIEATGVRAVPLRCDLSDAVATERLVGDAIRALPGLELIVNNASIFERAPLLETTAEALRRHFEINLFAPFILTRDFGRLVKRGLVINMADAMGARSRSNYAAYLLAKKSLVDLTRLAAVELAPGVRVNAIAPGLILPPNGEDDAYMERLAAKSPLGRRGSPEDITAAIGFLIDNPYVTGEILYIDGGQHLT